MSTATQLFVLHSEVSTQTLIDSLSRAAFNLRRNGMGAEDNRTAAILENILVVGPEVVEMRVVHDAILAIKRAKEQP